MKQIFYHGVVYTGDLPFASAFVVENGVFLYAGDDEGALKLAGEGDVITNLEGKFVCAGFNDSHMHLLSYGKGLDAAPMAEHTKSLQDLLASTKTYLEGKEWMPGQWLVGRGWNQDYFIDVKRMPNRFDLDEISTEIPICASRCCGHCLVVNSKALEIIGVTEETIAPEGGQIGIEDGILDGRFYDNAMDLVYRQIPLPTKEELKEYVRLACKSLNQYGVTSSQTDDYCVYRKIPWKVINEVYHELEEEGELTVRVYEQANFETVEALAEYIDAGNITGAGSNRFKIGPLKMLGDGSLGARTAYLSRPYADDTSTRGLPVFSKEQFESMIGYANKNGMQVAVHAIGDQCLDAMHGPYLEKEAFSVKEAIDSYTKNGAYQSFEETIKGQIKSGYLADFVILGENLFTIDATEIRQIPVLETYVGGEKVYQK